jgi:nitrogen regulatory protein P-II 1
MKKIEAILRPSALRSVLDSLKQSGYPGVMVTEVQGHGKQKGITESYRGQTVEGLLPKLVVTVVVPDAKLKKTVANIIASARTGEIGDGKIFISPVGETIRIRTGEKGEKALQ